MGGIFFHVLEQLCTYITLTSLGSNFGAVLMLANSPLTGGDENIRMETDF